MEVRMPEDILPIENEETYLQLGMLYNEGGRPEELGNRRERLIKQKGISDKDKIKYATIYYQYLKDAEKSLQIIEPIYAKNQEDVEMISLLVRLYEDSENYEAATRLLDNWLTLHPTDKGAEAMRDQYRSKIPKNTADSLVAPDNMN